MAYAVLLVCIALMAVTLVALCMAFSQGEVSLPDGAGAVRRGRFSLKWFGAGVVAAGLAVLLFVAVFLPAIVRERIVEAEELTRKTFREKLGREPDKIIFDDTNRQTGWDGWKYVGTADVGVEVWDVTVTRSNDRSAKTSTLECVANPRK